MPLDDLFRSNKQRVLRTRWDHKDIHQVSGTYGDYLLNKVGKVFPQLFGQIHVDVSASPD